LPCINCQEGSKIFLKKLPILSMKMKKKNEI
jgi:hypothetical protein